MMLNFLSDSFTACGICSSIILGVLILAFIQYGHVLSTFVARLVNENSESLLSEEKEAATSDKKSDDVTQGYTPEQLKEIARCAMLLHEYKPDDEAESKKSLVCESQQLGKNLSDLTKRSKMLDTESVDDGDSMMVNFPNENNPEIDMDDLTPDDITISDENEEEDSEAHISPQAIADIEAELLDSSILDESVEEHEEDIEEENQQKEIDRVVEAVARSPLIDALEELGMELIINDVIIEDLQQQDSSLYEVIYSRGEIEEVFAEGSQIPNRKNKLQTVPKIEAQLIPKPSAKGDFVSPTCQQKKFFEPSGDEINPNEGKKKSMKPSSSVKLDSRTGGGLKSVTDSSDSVRRNAEFVGSNEEIAGPSNRQTPKKAILNAEETFHIQAMLGCCDEELYSLYLEVIANYLTRKCVTEAIEELVEQIDDDLKDEPSSGSKLEKISKIHAEKKRLSEEELEEERRIQRSQLSDILSLMEQNPQMFGNVTKEVLTEQANLYCV